jgi:hypothetical protein
MRKVTILRSLRQAGDDGVTRTQISTQLVVLRGQNPRAVLDREAETLNRLMTETGAPCWRPDPPSTGACHVE